MALYSCKECNRDNLLADEIIWNSIYPGICKSCKAKKSKEYRNNGGINYSRNKSFKYKYGITLEQYEQMLINQNNCCITCKNEFNDENKPDVDHNHKTGKVRGILCHRCNLAIGYLREDEDILWNVLEYLKQTTWNLTGESNVQTSQ